MPIPGRPASPRNSAYTDQPQAASVPMLMSVSIVAAPWRAFAHAARCMGHAPHSTTGVASWSASHCQRSNCSAGTMDSRRVGTASAAEIASRRRRVPSPSSSSAAGGGAAPGRVAW